MTMIELRDERVDDVLTISDVTREAFASAPHSSGTEPAIVEALRSVGQLTVSLVAVIDGGIVGHVAVSPVSISDGTAGWHGLGPVSVLPEYQRQGIGAGLVREALRRLQALGAGGCVVLGEPGYYGRFGFVVVPGLVLPGVPPACFQTLYFGGPCPRGEVRYAAAFDIGG